MGNGGELRGAEEQLRIAKSGMEEIRSSLPIPLITSKQQIGKLVNSHS